MSVRFSISSLNLLEFMPNYQEMMNTTMGAMGGGGSSAGAASTFANFTSVNVMLKGKVQPQFTGHLSQKHYFVLVNRFSP